MTKFIRFFVILLFLSLAHHAIHAQVTPNRIKAFKSLGIGPCMDAAIQGDYAYIIGSGKIYIADITDPSNPVVTGQMGGLGVVRQIVVKGKTAYITSREDGAFLVDVSDPKKPSLLCHYNSVEVATGMGISGSIMFIANRGHGVEIVDVSDPKKPQFLSIVRTGEAQSVDIKDGYLYTGVHGAKFLVTTDVSNPRKPRITSEVELDGQGDGIYIQGNYLYISTGNSSRAQPNRKAGDPGYDNGHGLEIFELSDPTKPKFVSRVKFDRLHAYPDLWNVEVSGDYAFCSDTANGLYIVDIKNKKQPRVTAHFPVDQLGDGKQANYSGGLAVVDDYIYLAGGRSDLHLVEAGGIAKKQSRAYDESVVLGPAEKESPADYTLLKPEGQVWAVDVMGGQGVAACGMGGWYHFALGENPKLLDRYDTTGFAMGIVSRDPFVYVATNLGKIEIWKKQSQGGFAKSGEYQSSSKQAIKRFFALKDQPYALMQIGMSHLEIIDLSNPEEPIRAMVHKTTGYINEVISGNLFKDQFAYAAWHVTGMLEFDLKASPPKYTGRMLAERGVRGVCAVKDKLLVFKYGSYNLYDIDGNDFQLLSSAKLGRGFTGGVPVPHENFVILSSRPMGQITILDFSDAEKVRQVKTFSTSGNPGPVKIHKNQMIVPDGYGGIRIYANPLQ